MKAEMKAVLDVYSENLYEQIEKEFLIQVHKKGIAAVETTKKGNRYYNLDLGSNPIVALCLDNMNEYYVGIRSNRKNAGEWDVPVDKIDEYEKLETNSVKMANFFDKNTRKDILIEEGVKEKNCAYVTYKEGCYDFLIGIQFLKKKILYTRVDLLDYKYAFSIDGWFAEQTMEES